MQTISILLYNLVLYFYRFGIYFTSFFNKKAKLWIDGRKQWQSGLRKIEGKKGKRIWFHCASLGEFEQARPVIEKLRSERKNDIIIVSFFSPSGYEIRKNYEHADLVTYLPLDTKTNAKEFISIVNPDLVLFVKYEFWFNYINELKKKNIPVILFSSTFRQNQIFFRWHGMLFRSMLKMFSKIFVQNIESKELLQNISVESNVSFDTRFDRVNQIAQNKKSFPAVEKFKGNSKILISGSTWERDEELIIRCINENVLKEYKYIIAPHNVNQIRIDEIIRSITLKTKRFSELNEETAKEVDVVIIDNVGNLSSLYSYGAIAYIGGGFNAGIHNVLEAAVFGIPVLFGPNFKKSIEAKELLSFKIHDFNSLKEALTKIAIESERVSLGLKGKEFITERLGGTEKVFESAQFYLKD